MERRGGKREALSVRITTLFKRGGGYGDIIHTF